MKRLIWTALVTAASAAGAALAMRAADYAWRKVMHEPTPGPSKWAKVLLQGPMKKQAARRLHATMI